MLTPAEHMDIHFLKRQGHSVRQIARLTGHARNTVRTILRSGGLRTPEPRRRKTKLDPHLDYLRERAATGLSAVRLLAELQARGYAGGIHAVRRFLAGLEQRQQARGRATVRYETGPGEQAQVDWKHVGTFANARGSLWPSHAATSAGRSSPRWSGKKHSPVTVTSRPGRG